MEIPDRPHDQRQQLEWFLGIPRLTLHCYGQCRRFDLINHGGDLPVVAAELDGDRAIRAFLCRFYLNSIPTNFFNISSSGIIVSNKGTMGTSVAIASRRKASFDMGTMRIVRTTL
jgi:hypothetical protein